MGCHQPPQGPFSHQTSARASLTTRATGASSCTQASLCQVLVLEPHFDEQGLPRGSWWPSWENLVFRLTSKHYPTVSFASSTNLSPHTTYYHVLYTYTHRKLKLNLLHSFFCPNLILLLESSTAVSGTTTQLRGVYRNMGCLKAHSGCVLC